MAANKRSLEKLHDLLAAELAKVIAGGEASPAHMAVALNLLKHNGIVVKPLKNAATANLVESLPFAGQEAFDEDGNPLTH